MTPQVTTPGPALAADKTATQIPQGAPPAPKPWYVYDDSVQNLPTESQSAQPAVQAPAAKALTPAPIPKKRRLDWSWNFKLIIGDEELPRNTGSRFIDFDQDPRSVVATLRLCDDFFDGDVPQYIGRRIQRCILGGAKKGVDPGEKPETELLVKLNYRFKVATEGERAWERRGESEYGVVLGRQMHGQITAVRWYFDHEAFRFVRAEFRRAAARWIRDLPQSAASELALGRIERDIGQMMRPDMVPDDEFPPSIHDIEIASTSGFA